MKGRGYDLIIFAPARLVSPGTSGQGRGCIDMTAPFCGQTRTRGAGRPHKSMNYTHAAAPERRGAPPDKPAGSCGAPERAIKIRNEDLLWHE
jgi:hypothetical protein